MGGFEYRIRIGDVGRNHERGRAEFFRLLFDFVERGGIARDQGKIGAGLSEAQRDGAADTRGGAGNDDGCLLQVTRGTEHLFDWVCLESIVSRDLLLCGQRSGTGAVPSIDLTRRSATLAGDTGNRS